MNLAQRNDAVSLALILVMAVASWNTVWAQQPGASPAGDSAATARVLGGTGNFQKDTDTVVEGLSARKRELAEDGGNDRVHLALLVDISRSMSSWWGEVPGIATRLVQELDPQDKDLVSVLAFDDHLQRLCEREPVDEEYRIATKYVPDEMSETWGTNARWAIHEAFKYMQQSREKLREDRSEKPVAEQFLIIISDRFNDPPQRSSQYYDDYLVYNAISPERNAPPDPVSDEYRDLKKRVDEIVNGSADRWITLGGVGIEMPRGWPIFRKTEVQRVEIDPTSFDIQIDPEMDRAQPLSAMAYNAEGERLDRDFIWKVDPEHMGQIKDGKFIPSQGAVMPGGESREVKIRVVTAREPIGATAYGTIIAPPAPVTSDAATWKWIVALIALVIIALIAWAIYANREKRPPKTTEAAGAAANVLDLALHIQEEMGPTRSMTIKLEDGGDIALGRDDDELYTYELTVTGAPEIFGAMRNHNGHLYLHYQRGTDAINVNSSAPPEEPPMELHNGDMVEIKYTDTSGESARVSIEVTMERMEI